jgi:hypothetical protein
MIQQVGGSITNRLLILQCQGEQDVWVIADHAVPLLKCCHIQTGHYDTLCWVVIRNCTKPPLGIRADLRVDNHSKQSNTWCCYITTSNFFFDKVKRSA